MEIYNSCKSFEGGRGWGYIKKNGWGMPLAFGTLLGTIYRFLYPSAMLKYCLGKIVPILLATTTLISYLCQMYLETGANKPHSRLEEFWYE